MNYASGSLAAPAATGNQDITTLGFQPKFIRLTCVKQTTEADGAPAALSKGMTDFTTHCCVAVIADDAATPTNTYTKPSGNVLEVLLNGGGTVESTVDTASALSNGFRLHWSVVSANAWQIYWEAWGGSDITVKVGTWAPSGTGLKSLSGLGLGGRPDMLMFLASQSAAGANGTIGVGACSGVGQEYATCFDWADNRTSSPTTRYWHKPVSILLELAGTAELDAICSSLDPDGFTMNFSTNAAVGNVLYYAAIRGGRWKVGYDTAPAATGTKQTSGIGFQPVCVRYFGSANVANSGIVTGQNRYFEGKSIGVNTSKNVSCSVKSGATPSQTKASMANKAIRALNADGTTVLNSDMSAWDSDSFTLNYTNTQSGYEFGYFAFATVGNQVLVADRAVNVGLWTNDGGSADPLLMAGSISDLTSDSTYVTGPASPTSVSKVRFKLQNANAPGNLTFGNFTMKVRYKKDVTPGTDRIDMNVRLYQGGGSTFGGGTLIASRAYPNVGAVTEDDYNLSAGEISAITDWTDLYVEFDEIKV